MASISTPEVTVPTDEELLAHVEAFLERTKPHGMTPTRFGIEAMREGGLVGSLRGGRSLSLKNVNKVLDYIQRWRPDSADGSVQSATKADQIIRQEGEGGEADSLRPFAPTSATCSPTAAHPPSSPANPASSTDGDRSAPLGAGAEAA